MTAAICPCCGFDLVMDEVIETGALFADPRGDVRFRGRDIHLTTSEKVVLMSIAKERGRTVSRLMLRERLGTDSESNVIDVLMNRVRNKLGEPTAIESIRGQGWRWAA